MFLHEADRFMASLFAAVHNPVAVPGWVSGLLACGRVSCRAAVAANDDANEKKNECDCIGLTNPHGARLVADVAGRRSFFNLACLGESRLARGRGLTLVGCACLWLAGGWWIGADGGWLVESWPEIIAGREPLTRPCAQTRLPGSRQGQPTRQAGV